MENVQNTSILRGETKGRFSFFRMITIYLNLLLLNNILLKLNLTKNYTKLNAIPSIWISIKIFLKLNLLEKEDLFIYCINPIKINNSIIHDEEK